METPRSVRFPPPPAGLEVRDAVPADNDALIALELESPLALGDSELAFDRTPDFFARHRLHPGCRIVVGALEGRLVGVLASVIHSAPVGGRRRLLQYIHQGRVHRAAQRRGVASALSAELLLWGRERGVDSPYWLISETNTPSMSFGGRGGGLWPVPARFHDYDTRSVRASPAAPLPADALSEAVTLINDTHRGQELFEPFTVDSFAARLALDPQYGRGHLRCVMENGRVVAVAGLWDEGRTAKEVRRDRSTGETHVTSAAAALDWGWAPGHEGAFAGLLRSLAVEARSWGRDTLIVCAPALGALPDAGLPVRAWELRIFAPGIEPPPAADVSGVFIDLARF